MTLKVVFCWSDISGYMAACWRALQQQPEVEIFVIAFQARTETSFAEQLMEGIPCQLLDLVERQDTKLIKRLILQEHPDVLVLCGWFHSPYRYMAFDAELQDIPKVMGMDTPWQGTLKQRLAPWLLYSYLRRMARVVVTGERSWHYARYLGVPSARIERGLYGIDYANWSPIYARRRKKNWPHSFLFAGRYALTKGVDLLFEAYQCYRAQVSDPWSLVCCGQGDLASYFQGQTGITDQGFLQPFEMQAIWEKVGAFVLPSRFDPWPLALVEAAATGLPIVCTDVCGSAVEVVRSGYNGYIVPENDFKALSQALVKIHQHYDDLPFWGARSQQLAAPYAAEVWAIRWHELMIQLQGSVEVDKKSV